MPSTNAPPGHFKVLYFAAASSYTKKDHEMLKAPLPASGLLTLLGNEYPGIEALLSSCAVTVNLQYIDLEEEDGHLMINEGDEVAIIPPVSSG
ncbi:uncharacterized protein K452DRAFT_290872 [Aplosporella prunicola CBS 121167]|uniref:Molybdopterin synthase sulfur carrier subunit n=1 Tax=Aplosporella prunicola CBS 121167 TaxID=1176127 RepID=A0A6A6B2K2_9PEZI|nr:uncharacterized protein K452DRAFT_290872 [Aplosporella prunicola CBS 121167]KAF2138280.1 hypothetical protein K452DRAFT_290872 [Aplosporella prunicola CBS 121167]